MLSVFEEHFFCRQKLFAPRPIVRDIPTEPTLPLGYCRNGKIVFLRNSKHVSRGFARGAAESHSRLDKKQSVAV